MKRSKRTANSFRRYIRRYLKAMCRKRRNQKKHRSVRCQRAQVLFRMSFILIIASILFTNEKSQKITSEKSKSVQTSEHYLLENNPLEKNKYQPLNYLVIASILFTNEKSQKITSEKSKSVQTSEHYLLENNPLEKNKYQPLNYLVVDYFTKLSSGDLDGICKLYESFSEESFEKIKTGQNLAEWYQGIDIYTKKAKEPHAYVAFVSYHMKLRGADLLLPGLETMYVREEKDGQGIDIYTKKAKEPHAYVAFVSYHMKLRGADLLLPGLETMYVREEKDGTFHLVDKPYEPEVEQEIRALAKERAVRELLCQVENQYAYASRDKEALQSALAEQRQRSIAERFGMAARQ